MEEREMVERLWRRESGALEALQQQYGERLLRLALRFLKRREDAEEVVNDTWLTAWNTIPPQRPESLSAYLFRLCRFSALGRVDWLDAQKRKATVVELTEELAECIPDPHGAQPAEDLALVQALNDFLAGLPEGRRTLFLKRYWYGEPIKELSAQLGMGESKVKTTLLRLRRALKNHLRQEGISV